MSNQHLQNLLQKKMSRKEFLGFSLLAIASIFGVAGLIRQLASHAATPVVSNEPENDTVTTPATIVTDTTASGSKAVKFGPASGGGGGGGGTETASYGPNGTHSPLKVVAYSTSPNVTVACSWSAISAAIVTAQSQPSTADYVIAVSAGTLTGSGIGSAAASVLSNLLGPASNLGANRARRILVKPASGYGTVTVSGGMKVTDVNGVVFAGLVCNGGIQLDATNSAFWRIKTNSVKMLRGKTVELVEVYAIKTTMDNDDTSDLWAYNGNIDGLILNGVWIGPSWGDGTGKHIDTLQFEPFTGFVVSNLQIKNSLFVGRVQTNAWSGPTTMTHNLLLSQGSMTSRYPTPSNGVIYDSTAIMNGGAAKCQVTLNDWTGVGNLTGAIGTKTAGEGIVSVSNSKINGSAGTLTGFTAITTPATTLCPANPNLAAIWT